MKLDRHAVGRPLDPIIDVLLEVPGEQHDLPDLGKTEVAGRKRDYVAAAQIQAFLKIGERHVLDPIAADAEKRPLDDPRAFQDVPRPDEVINRIELRLQLRGPGLDFGQIGVQSFGSAFQNFLARSPCFLEFDDFLFARRVPSFQLTHLPDELGFLLVAGFDLRPIQATGRDRRLSLRQECPKHVVGEIIFDPMADEDLVEKDRIGEQSPGLLSGNAFFRRQEIIGDLPMALSRSDDVVLGNPAEEILSLFFEFPDLSVPLVQLLFQRLGFVLKFGDLFRQGLFFGAAAGDHETDPSREKQGQGQTQDDAPLFLFISFYHDNLLYHPSFEIPRARCGGGKVNPFL